MLTRRRALALTLAQLAIPAALALFPGESLAQGPAPRVEIIVLYARQDPSVKPPATQMGPGVPKLPQLSQPPFSGYNTFSFVGQTTLKLDAPKPGDPWKGRPSGTYALVPGKPIQIALI